MRYLKPIYFSLALTLVMGCSEDASERPDDNGYIKLSASMGSMTPVTRATADPYLGDSPSEERPLATSLWFSTESGVYPHAPAGQTLLPVHTNLTFDGSQTEYVLYNNRYIQYPVDGEPVYCIGLYPDDNNWTLSDDNKRVSHEIDGNTDLMFARPIVGSWNEHFGSIRYEHTLSWIKIAVCAVSFDALNAWGKLKKISIYSAKSVDIDLATEAVLVPGTNASENLEDRYTYYPDITTDKENGQWIETLNLKEPIDITSTMDELGSVFCSPAKEYRLKIETENNTVETTVKLNWLDLDTDDVTELQIPGRARGRCFVISLYFHPYSVVTAACTLDKWNTETDDIYLKGN